MAGSAAFTTDDRTGGDASLVLTIIFGTWWSIAGVPERYLKDDQSNEGRQ